MRSSPSKRGLHASLASDSARPPKARRPKAISEPGLGRLIEGSPGRRLTQRVPAGENPARPDRHSDPMAQASANPPRTFDMASAGDAGIAAAVAALGRGELVAMPTETVYGLAADATDADAVGAHLSRQGPAAFQSADRPCRFAGGGSPHRHVRPARRAACRRVLAGSVDAGAAARVPALPSPIW